MKRKAQTSRTANGLSEQAMIAHEELIQTSEVDLDKLSTRITDPAALAEFERVRAASEARLLQIDAETQAFIAAENAKYGSKER